MGRCIVAASVIVATASAQTDVAPRVKATNVAELKKLFGKEVTVYGDVISTGQSSQGHQFLNFADRGFAVVCLPEDVANFSAGLPSKLYRGESVEVTGKVDRHRDKLQIRLRQPGQIRIIDPVSVSSKPPTAGPNRPRTSGKTSHSVITELDNPACSFRPPSKGPRSAWQPRLRASPHAPTKLTPQSWTFC